jgi:hypothetical protein
MMEALACKDGLQLAQQSGVFKLCLETDSPELLKLNLEGIGHATFSS